MATIKNPEGRSTNFRNGKFGNKERNVDVKKERKEGVYVNSFHGEQNDPTWYNTNKDLLDDVARISFGNQLGRSYRLDRGETDVPVNLEVPTIMTLNMMTVPGYSDSSTSGASLACQGVFSYMRKKLSTLANYQAADVGMYVLGIDAIYSYYSHIMRLFGMINLYSSRNLSFPKALIKAATNWNDAAIEDFRSNINIYRSKFNNLIYKASALYLPTHFTIVARHAWLYGSIFTDSRNVKAQIYLHAIGGSYILDEQLYPTGTALRQFWRAEDPLGENLDDRKMSSGMEGTLNVWNAMIDAFRNSDAMLNIQADMNRAFDGEPSWELAICDEEFMCELSHTDEVLSQINNLTIVEDYGNLSTLTMEKDGNPFSVDSKDVYQDVSDNTILFTPFMTDSQAESRLGDRYSSWAAFQMTRKVLNFHWDQPTPDDIAVATRNTSVATYTLNGPIPNRDCWVFDIIGADVCTGIYFTVQDKDNISGYHMKCTNLTTDFGAISKWACFDWAPTWVEASVDPEAPGDYTLLQDYDNFVDVDNEFLKRLNNNIILNMWSIPELGVYLT